MSKTKPSAPVHVYVLYSPLSTWGFFFLEHNILSVTVLRLKISHGKLRRKLWVQTESLGSVVPAPTLTGSHCSTTWLLQCVVLCSEVSETFFFCAIGVECVNEKQVKMSSNCENERKSNRIDLRSFSFFENTLCFWILKAGDLSNLFQNEQND